MKVSEVKLVRRVSTGEYQFDEVTMTATTDKGETGAKVLADLDSEISKGLGKAGPAEAPAEEEKPAKTAKPAKATKAPAKEEAEEEEEADDEESEEASAEEDEAEDSEEDADESEEDDADSDDEEEEEKPKSKKGFKKKPQNYDRAIEAHKTLFSGILAGIKGKGWAKDESFKKTAKAASVKMMGQPFLDENGEVLPLFSTKVKKFVRGK